MDTWKHAERGSMAGTIDMKEGNEIKKSQQRLSICAK